METPPAIEIVQLTKEFRVPFKKSPLVAVCDLSLRVEPGQVYGLIGPNGSGKSTTMKALLGLIHPTAGETRIFGRDSRYVDSRTEVGYLPENPYFYRFLTGRETIQFFGRLCGMKKGELKDRAEELLEFVGLVEAGNQRLSGYSKGMLQRIGLAQAIVHDPNLVVLDEPTAGVDPAGSRIIRDLILSLRERGKTVIFSSHLLDQVQEVSDQFGIISKGKLVKEGKLAELIAIEDQTEIVLRGASLGLQEKIVKIIESEGDGAEVVRVGKPRTTLERLFLQETES